MSFHDLGEDTVSLWAAATPHAILRSSISSEFFEDPTPGTTEAVRKPPTGPRISPLWLGIAFGAAVLVIAAVVAFPIAFDRAIREESPPFPSEVITASEPPPELGQPIPDPATIAAPLSPPHHKEVPVRMEPRLDTDSPPRVEEPPVPATVLPPPGPPRLRVIVEGDATKVSLQGEDGVSYGPDSVPAGKYAVMASFGSARPVKAAVLEIGEGAQTRVRCVERWLRCNVSTD
jgi:hypothetical protein